MDIDRFALKIRTLASGSASRRLVMASVFGAIAASRANGVADAKRHKRKRCKKSKKCGKGCCVADVCFVSKDPDSQPIDTPLCCPPDLLCRSLSALPPDQCCYPGEVCDPNWINTDPLNADGNCYLPCGINKCNYSQQCVNGECEILNTARVPRSRR